MSPQAATIHDLFRQYLEICNQAMEKHKEVFPYKHIWEAAEAFQGDKGLHLTIFDDEPKGDYQLRLQDKHIEVVDEQDVPEEQMGWRMNTSYLKHVIEHPDDYINEPSKLDWLWLKYRDDA